jgi:hypothetical protein
MATMKALGQLRSADTVRQTRGLAPRESHETPEPVGAPS